MNSAPMLKRADMQATLMRTPWFSALPPEVRSELATHCEPLMLAQGEMLFRQGDAPDGFYVLLDGHIKMSTLTGDGKESILAILDPGTWFGEISLIDGEPRTHDATALEAAHLAWVEWKVFRRLMQQASFAAAIAGLLARRVRMLYSVVEDAHLRAPAVRIARRLLWLAAGITSGREMANPAIPVSQEALAMMLGISRQTLSAELQRMQDAGWIRLHYRCIEVLSSDALQQFARR